MVVRQARYIKEIEDYRVLSRENFEYYPHFHVQIEIMYLERGREEVIIDGSHFRMEEGDVCISFPNQVHEYRLLEENMACLLIMPIEDVEEYRQELTEYVPENPVVRKDGLPGYFSQLWYWIILRSIIQRIFLLMGWQKRQESACLPSPEFFQKKCIPRLLPM